MLHLTGAALLLAASALLRRAILSRARQQRQTLRVLSDGFLSLAQAVRATLTPFPALLETVPREGAAGMFFSSVRALLSRGETLSDAWRTAAEALPLPERERSAVASLASALGGEEESVCAALHRASAELFVGGARPARARAGGWARRIGAVLQRCAAVCYSAAVNCMQARINALQKEDGYGH